jgi:hypothetical protein
VYVYYFSTPPAPGNIKLYQPFNNRECLHCHLGARSFEEGRCIRPTLPRCRRSRPINSRACRAAVTK